MTRSTTHQYPSFFSFTTCLFVFFAFFAILSGCSGTYEQRRCSAIGDCMAGESCLAGVCSSQRHCNGHGDCMGGEQCKDRICQQPSHKTPPSIPRQPTSPTQPVAPKPPKAPQPPTSSNEPPKQPAPPKQPEPPKQPKGLSKDTFLYVTSDYSDQDNVTRQVYAHNVKTDQSRKLFLLNRVGGQHFRELGGHVALSPDRQWIAFLSKYPMTKAQQDQRYPMSSLWLASLDGRTVKRVSQPFFEADSDINHRSIRRPQWSHDSKWIWVSYFESRGSNIKVYRRRMRIHVATGKAELIDESVFCHGVREFQMSRRKPLYIMASTECFYGDLYFVDAALASVRAYDLNQLADITPTNTLALYEGLAFFIAYPYAELNKASEDRQMGIYVFDPTRNMASRVTSIPKGHTIPDFATSPDPKKPQAVVRTTNYKGEERVVYVDFSTNTKRTLTIPKRASSFSW